MATKTKKSKKPSFPRTVTVTQKHIDNSAPGDSTNCAIAVALREHFENLGFDTNSSLDIAESGESTISLSLDIKLPNKIDSFIRKFDEDEPDERNFDSPARFKAEMKKWKNRVKPFSFSF